MSCTDFVTRGSTSGLADDGAEGRGGGGTAATGGGELDNFRFLFSTGSCCFDGTAGADDGGLETGKRLSGTGCFVVAAGADACAFTAVAAIAGAERPAVAAVACGV